MQYACTHAHELNSLASLKSKSVKIVPNAPWFYCEYENLRKLHRKAEKQSKRTGLEDYRNLRKQTTDFAFTKKCKYYTDNCPNSKTLFSVINKLLDKNRDVVLPSGKNDKELANSFLDYFIKKIENTLSYSIYVGNKLSSFHCLLESSAHQRIPFLLIFSRKILICLFLSGQNY